MSGMALFVRTQRKKSIKLLFVRLLTCVESERRKVFFGENMWSESRRSVKRRRIAVMIIALVTEWLPVRPRKSVVRSKRGRYEKQKGQAFVRASSLLCSPCFLCRLRVCASDTDGRDALIGSLDGNTGVERCGKRKMFYVKQGEIRERFSTAIRRQ